MSKLNYSRFKKDNYIRDNVLDYYSDYNYQSKLRRSNLSKEQKELISDMYFSDIFKKLNSLESNILKSCLGKKYLSDKQKKCLNNIYKKYYL